jgi:hypothetical protein
MLLGNWIYSQDSIRFKDNNNIAVKISEVGIVDIKYHRFDNLDGPQYVVNKQDIRYIKFQNGVIDTMRQSNVLTENTSLIKITEKAKISSIHCRLYYNYEVLNYKQLQKLITTIENDNEKTLLLNEFDIMRKHKLKQYTYAYSGWVLGFIAANALSGIVQNNPSKANSTTIGLSLLCTATWASFIIIGHSISHDFKIKRYREQTAIAETYNNL